MSHPSSLPAESRRYVPIASLGHGGMADVFLVSLAGEEGFQKLAVLKRLQPALRADVTFASMFYDEARLMARMNHPCIVQSFEVGTDEEGTFLAMEYLDGRSLASVRKRLARTEEALPVSLGLHVIIEVLSALHYAHELTDYDGTPLGVVHRDVSPQNVLVTYSGHTKLLDFGVAKASSASVETRVGTLKGKVNYMAPEQASGDTVVDARTDVFSAGIMLWELLAGRRLWLERNELHVLASLVRHDPIPLPSSFAEVDPGIESVCMRALKMNRAERFDTAHDFQCALEDAVASAGLRASSRELASFMSIRFEKDRRAVRTAIEQFQRDRRSMEALPDLHRAIQSGSSPGSYSGLSPIESGSRPRSGTPSRPGRASAYPEPTVRPSTPVASNPVPGQTLPSARIDSVPHLETTTPTNRTKSALLMAIALGVGALVVLALVLSGRERRATPPTSDHTESAVAPAPHPGPSTPVPPVAQTAAPRAVALDVSVSPMTAKISIDGVAVAGNPYRTTFAPSDDVHRIEVSAPGFVPRRFELVLNRDRSVEIGLVPLTGGPVAHKAAAAASGAAPSGAPLPAQQPAGMRELDVTPKPNRTAPGIDNNAFGN